MAKELNITESYLSQIKTGLLMPGRKTARRIEVLTKGEVTFEELRMPKLQRVISKARNESRFAS